jgi:formate hydrogenlyase transcriptional activator
MNKPNHFNLRENSCTDVIYEEDFSVKVQSQFQNGLAIFNSESIRSPLRKDNNNSVQSAEDDIYLKEYLEIQENYSEIIGSSSEMEKVFQLISQVSPSKSTVLILGETGTGKELIARAIHNASPRKDKIMVKVNCAALPIHLIESELFGHERGSFTGATERRIGKFEMANNGTLFLDEIGEMPLDLQVKLLRVLQEKEIERIGGTSTIKVNVRIIAATNRNLQHEVADSKFRSDLYYRLNVFPITLPSLRDRREDIGNLTAHFIAHFSNELGKKINSISKKVQYELSNYDWPGNVRELEHVIERSILLTHGTTLKEVFLPISRIIKAGSNHSDDFVVKTLDDNERDYIIKVLNKCNGKLSGYGGAATLLGVPSSTLSSKIAKLKITKEQILKNTK